MQLTFIYSSHIKGVNENIHYSIQIMIVKILLHIYSNFEFFENNSERVLWDIYEY